MTVVTLNGVDSDTAVPELEILQVRRQLVGARRDMFTEVPGRAGSWAFVEEPGDRYITIVCDLQATTFANRRDAVRKLADWADTPRGAVRLIVDDEDDRFWLVMLNTAPEVDEWLTFVTGLELEFRASPYAQALDITDETINATGSDESGSFAVADGIIAYPEVTVTPTNGTLTALTLQINGNTLEWAGLVSDDADLAISSISSTVVDGTSIDTQLTGRYEPNDLDMADVSGEFPLIEPGTNTYDFEWLGTATAVTFVVRWRRRYR